MRSVATSRKRKRRAKLGGRNDGRLGGGSKEELNSVVRRALAMATGEQYFRLAVNFASIIVVSRLLTPTEIGISVIGMGITAIALGLREFATSDFLIQREQVTRDDIRASFTVAFVLTALIASAIGLLAPWFGSLYGEEKLAAFLRVCAVAALVETVSFPAKGLLRRDMAFGALALINTACAVVTAMVTVLLASLGFSYMSVAWAMVAGSAATALACLYYNPDLSVFRPAFRSWDRVLTFGGYSGFSYVINRAHESLPQLVLGQVLPASAVGLYNRAKLVSDIPDKVFLASVSTIAFPALAAQVRKGSSLREPYLQALGHVTVFYWPALVLLALLAYPVVSLVLGHQWLDVVPLFQIMAVAGLAWFPDMLTTPVLLAVNANRDRVLAVLLTRSVSGLVLCVSAYFGIVAMAASRLLTLPYQMVLSLYFVRRHTSFQWCDLWSALWKSAVVTASSAVGPAIMVALSDSGLNLSIAATLVAVLLAGAGWFAGVLLTRHPILLEVAKAADGIASTRHWRRLFGRIVAYAPKADEMG
jgi:O-antigen/teichoic acid export membrane protein